MSFLIKKATRKVSKMRIGLFGPSGSGKTYSALLLAKGLVGDFSKVIVIDTENGSADLYSDLGDYSTLTLSSPFTSGRYIEAIQACEKAGFECIIIDSISHEWEDCILLHSRLGGKFETWAKVTPIHNSFIQAVVQSTCHIITTGRSKVDYNFESKTAGGKGKVEKIGMKTVTREGFDYEMTLAFQINQEHYVTTDKDRTGMFNDITPFIITEAIGEKIRKWNESGEVIVVPKKEDELFIKIYGLMRKLTDSFNDKDKLNNLLKEMSVNGSNDIKILSDEQKYDLIAFLEHRCEENNII